MMFSKIFSMAVLLISSKERAVVAPSLDWKKKLMKKANLLALAGIFLLLNVAHSSAAIIVLKEGTALEAGGTFTNSAFASASSANVTQITVEDTYHHSNNATWNTNRGTATTAQTSKHVLFKYDLSVLGVGAVINSAEFRVRATNGNSTVTLAPIITHDWVESSVTGNSPIGDNTDGNQWGPSGNDSFSSADYGTPSNFDSDPVGNAFLVEDVTSIVQAAYAAPASNFGWSVQNGNHNLILSENSSEGRRPALFIDYEPGVIPEPSSLLLGALGLGLCGVARTRHS